MILKTMQRLFGSGSMQAMVHGVVFFMIYYGLGLHMHTSRQVMGTVDGCIRLHASLLRLSLSCTGMHPDTFAMRMMCRLCVWLLLCSWSLFLI